MNPKTTLAISLIVSILGSGVCLALSQLYESPVSLAWAGIYIGAAYGILLGYFIGKRAAYLQVERCEGRVFS